MRKNLLISLIIICTTLLTVSIVVSAENFYQQRMEIREATFIEKILNFFGGGFNIYIGSQGAPSDLDVSVGETVTVKFVMSDFGTPADVSSYKVHTPAGTYDLTSNLKSLHDISVTYSFTPSTAGEFTIWESLVLYSKGTNPFIYNQVNVHVTSQAKTCSEKNGQICSSGYNCYGTIVTASDTSQCCVPDVNTGQKCVRVIDAECDSGTTKCVGQNYYECVSGLWKDKGLIIGQCGVTDVPPCTDSSWSPDTSTICSGTSFTQTSNCGKTRTSTGTKDCSLPTTCIVPYKNIDTTSSSEAGCNLFGFGWIDIGNCFDWIFSKATTILICSNTYTKEEFKKINDQSIINSFCDDSRNCNPYNKEGNWTISCVSPEYVGISLPTDIVTKIVSIGSGKTPGLCLAESTDQPEFLSYFEWAAWFDITQDGVKDGMDGLIIVIIGGAVLLIFLLRS